MLSFPQVRRVITEDIRWACRCYASGLSHLTPRWVGGPLSSWGHPDQSTKPISSSITPTRPRPEGSCSSLEGGQAFCFSRSFSDSRMAAGRLLDTDQSTVHSIATTLSLTLDGHAQHSPERRAPQQALLDDCRVKLG